MAMKQIMISLKLEHANVFAEEAQKIALPTSSFIRMILIQWLGDTGKIDHVGQIETQIGEAKKPEEYKI